MSAPIYSLRVPEVFEALETTAAGLSQADAETRLALYGQNILSQQKKESVWEKLLHELIRPPALVLIVVGLAALLARDAILALIIWSIIFVNMGFSFWREYRAEQAIERLREILPSFAHVIREGVESYIPASQLVPGDGLILAEGDNI